MPPELRLVGLNRDEVALALPAKVIFRLPDEYFRSLSPDGLMRLRRKLGIDGH